MQDPIDGLPKAYATGRELRKRARQLYREQFPTLILLYLPVVLLQTAAAVIRIALFGGAWAVPAAYLFYVLTYPITAVGGAALLLGAVRGEKLSFKKLFVGCAGWKKYWQAIRIGTVYSLFPVLCCDLLARTGLISEKQQAFASVLVLLLIVLGVLRVRGALVPCQLAEGMPGGRIASIRYSFWRMKGACWRYFGMRLCVRWWTILLFWALFRAFRSASPWVQSQPARVGQMSAMTMAMFCVNVLTGPYLGLCSTLLLATRLPAELPKDAFFGAEPAIRKETEGMEP